MTSMTVWSESFFDNLGFHSAAATSRGHSEQSRRRENIRCREDAVLVSGVRGEWSDWLKNTEIKQEITTGYNHLTSSEQCL